MAINNNPFGGSIDMAMVKKYIEEVGKSVTIDNKATESKTRLTSATKKQTDVLAQLNKLIQSNNAMNTKLGDITNKVNKAVDKQADLGRKLHYSWQKAFKSFTMYMSVTTIFYTSIRTLQSMVQEVMDLDKALTELQKVTDLQGDALDRFTDKAFRAGESIAKTGTEVIQATTEFAKAGYTEDDAMTLGKIALMYTNIADEEISAGEAAEFIIAQMKAFNIEATNSQHIIDAVNEVANKYAVSSADIANNLGKSSAVLSGAGVSFEQSIGLLTAGTEITRNASKVSNGLKTITLRLQGMNDEGERDLTLIPKMKEEFAKLNISLVDSNGNLKNTYEILSELAPKYNDMTAAEKAWITEAIAGKYQAQNTAAILQNFQVAIDATTTALNSNGSAAKENAVYVESIAGKVQNFNSAFEKLSYTTINSDFVKGVVDFGTSILKLTTDVGGLEPILTTILGIIIAVKAQKIAMFIDNTRLQLNLLGKDIKSAGGLFKYLQGVMAGTVTTTQALSLAFGALTIAISAGMMIYNAYQAHQEKISEQNKKIIKDTEAKIDAYNDESKTVKNLASEYINLKNSGKDDIETRTRISEIQTEIKDLVGEQADGLDLVNGKLDTQKTVLEDILQSSKDLTAEELKRADIASKQELRTANKELNNSSVPTMLNSWQQLSGVGSGKDFAKAPVNQKLDMIKDLQNYLTQAYDLYEGNSNYQSMISEQISTLQGYIDEYSEIYNQYEEIQKKIREPQLENDMFSKYGFSIGMSTEELSQFAGSMEDNKDVLDSDKEIIYELASQYYPEFTKALDDARGMCDISTASALGSAEAFDSLGTTLDGIQEKYDTLSDILESYNEDGYISVDALQKILTSGEDYLKYLDIENGKLVLNKQMLIDEANAKLDEAEATAYTNAITSISNALKMDEASANQIAGNSADILAGKIANLKTQYDELTKSQEVQKALETGGSAAQAISNAEKLLNTQLKIISSARGNLSKSLTSSSKSSSASDKAWWEKQLDALKQQFSYNEITLQEYINGLTRLLSQLRRGSDEWREVNNLLQKQKLSQVDDDYKRGTISLEQYIARLKELIKTYKYGTEVWNDLADKIKKANEELLGNQKNNYDKAYDAAINLIDEEIDKVQKLRDEREEYYDSQISSLEKLNDETERQITLTELQQNLINAQNEKNKRVFVAGIGWTWQADNQAINDAKKALTDFQNENAIKDLENARDAELATLDDVLEGWNNYKDAWSDIQNTFEDAQNRIMLAQQFGSNFEADILNGRLSALEKFKNDYINIQSQITRASGGIVPGITDYTSLANGISLNSSMPNSSSIASLLSAYTAPSIVAPATGGGASYTYNFDNLVLPSVTNSQQFIAELKSMINLTKNQ